MELAFSHLLGCNDLDACFILKYFRGMKNLYTLFLISFFLFLFSCKTSPEIETLIDKSSISGIYPHLAYYNEEGECGTGAVVPWSGSLWVITYGPHLPFGSSDKLYQITPDLAQIVRDESIGGTPANRMIQIGRASCRERV